MKPRLAVALALLALLGSACPAAEEPKADFYVAVDGNDANAGTKDKPFASLARARDAVRRLKKERPITVCVRGGTYFLRERLRLTPEDSGAKDAPVTYAAFPGETPVLSGGEPVRGEWTGPADGKVWSIQLPQGTWFQDLYVDGVRQPRARMPNEGFWNAKDIGKSKTVFGVDAGKLAAWPDAASGFAVVRPYQWCEFHLPIASVDAQKNTVTLAKPCGYPIVPGGYGAPGTFRIENVAAAVDRPGEWCLDRKTAVLRFLPPEGIDPRRAGITGASTIVLVAFDGEARAKKFVEYVVLRGLTFTQSGRVEKLEWGPFEGAAVRMAHGVRDCVIEDCRFADTGAVGLLLWKECIGNRVERCEFVRTGDTAVEVSDYLGEGPAMSGGNEVLNNHVHDCGVVRSGSTGILIAISEGNRVAHNLVEHLPYNGIALSATRAESWNPAAVAELKPPFTCAKVKPFIPARNNVFEFNHIHHVMQELGDGGAIYFWGLAGAGPNVIRNNLIHDVGKGHGLAVGIYLDDEMEDVEVRDNVVYRANWGLHLHGCSRCVLENNIFAYSRDTDISVQPERYNSEPMRNVIRRNIFFMGEGRLYYATNLALGNEPLREMNHNLYWRGAEPPAGKLTIGIAKGFDADSVIADPMFVAPQKDDFRLKPGSPALSLGFHVIDTAPCGPESRR